MTDLTIKELKGKRAKLEADLYLSISKLIDDFQHQNDVAVMSVSIDLVPTQAMQELGLHHRIGDLEKDRQADCRGR